MKKALLLLLGLGSGLGALAQVTSTSTAPIGPNLALNKPATASSVEGANLAARYAFDADYSSRWASDRTNPATVDTQWLAVDLGTVTTITKVRVNWEAAYGKDYQIQVSNDGSTWTPVRTVTGNTALVNLLSGLSASGRYVRLYGTARGTGYGYSVYELEVSASNTAPTVQLTQPAANSTYAGPVTLSADASDADGAVSKVDFYVDNVLVGSDNTAPFSVAWPTSSTGTHVAKAMATDDNGATATSYERTFYTSNPTPTNQPPTVALTSPAANATTSDIITLSADASDSDGTVSKVDLYVDNTLIRSFTSSPYSVRWATTTVANGSHIVKAVATDNAGATATDQRTFSVSNAGAPRKAVPGRLEAESYDAQSGIQTEPTADAGGGLNVGYLDAGDYLDYNISSATNSYYTIQLRVASVIDGAKLQLQNIVGLEGVATLATVTLPNTGGYQAWQTVTIPNVTLPVGDLKLRVKALTNGFNINWLDFSYTVASGARPALAVASPAPPAGGVELSAYPNPSTGLVYLAGVADGTPTTVFDALGRPALTPAVRNGALDLGTLPAGSYFVTLQHQGKAVRLPVLKN